MSMVGAAMDGELLVWAPLETEKTTELFKKQYFINYCEVNFHFAICRIYI